VEIHGLEEAIDAEILESKPLRRTRVDANGKLGCAAAYTASNDTYQVHTFDGLRLSVPNQNIRVIDQPTIESCGFDVCWPGDVDWFFDFVAHVHNNLVEKGFCVIQTVKPDKVREMVRTGNRKRKYVVPREEFARDFLGRGGSGKISDVNPLVLSSLEDVLDGLEQNETEFSQYDRDMRSILQVMGPMTWDSMGFTSCGCSETMIWRSFENSRERVKLEPPAALSSEDIEEGVVERHVNFIKRRRLCFMYMVDNSGGTLWLHPRSDLGSRPLKVPVGKGKLLVFRCDQFSFEFKPEGDHITLLAWVLDEPQDLQMLDVVATRAEKEDLQGLLKGPRAPEGERPHVVSLATLTGGNVHSLEEALNMYQAGIDGGFYVPTSRFDTELYFSKHGEDDFVVGVNSYHYHGALTNDADIMFFDYKFWGFTELEAELVSPAHRKILEVGYQALNNGGETKKTVNGEPITVYIGDCGNEWWHTNMIRAHVDGMWTRVPEADWLVSKMASIECSRLSYLLNMRGPTALMDTACSAGLTAFCTAMYSCKSNGAGKESCGLNIRSNRALAGGCNMITDAQVYIGNSSTHMLSVKGRCFTYDTGGDGYARGEGVSMAYVVMSDDDKDVDRQEGCAVGNKVNQDGRSASMTAPNGPSQQACIKAALREANCNPSDITASECHGTGTALGDPIEVGSLRGVQESDERDTGFCMTSAKSNISHLEANAGVTGLFKCILMSKYAVATPNVHLRSLNAHIDTFGWPVYFQQDAVDFGMQSGLVGVSSFGISGTNAHVEVFGLCKHGPNSIKAYNPKDLNYVSLTCPITMGPIDHVTGEAVPRNPRLDGHGDKMKYHADVIREELAPYDVSSYAYEGGYRYRAVDMDDDEENLDPGVRISICGSWNGFGPEDMELQDDGSFLVTILLGDFRFETFFLCLGGNLKNRIYPAIHDASPKIHIEGPDDHGEGKRWLIDGRDEEIPSGTVYQIRFAWRKERLLINWEEVSPKLSSLVTTSYLHTYQVLGTFTCGQLQELSEDPDEEEGTYYCNVRVGLTGEEEFQFVRDHDMQQIMYPASARCTKTKFPACGPDAWGRGKRWLIRAPVDEIVRISLTVVEPTITVVISSETKGEKVWESEEGVARHSFSVVGSWNDFVPEAMTADQDNPGVWLYRGVIGSNISDEFRCFYELFRILLDEDPTHAWHPAQNFATLGECLVEGPDDAGEDHSWVLKNPQAGSAFEIKLDFKALDRRRIVSWTWDCPPVYDFTGGALRLSVDDTLAMEDDLDAVEEDLQGLEAG